MRLGFLLVTMVLALGPTLSSAWAQEPEGDDGDKPETGAATVADDDGAEGEEEDIKDEPGRLRGKNGTFTMALPEGWQYRRYDRPEDAANAKMILPSVLEKGSKATDHFNVWWYPTPENLMSGVASVHRVELAEEADLQKRLEDARKSGKIPQGVQMNPAQVGKYASILTGGVVQKMFYVAVVYIAQGKVAYVSTIVGPQQMIPAQWAGYMKMLNALQTEELKPTKVEEVFGGAAAPAEG